MKQRRDSFFGLHFDFHARPEFGVQGATLREEDIRTICKKLRPDFIQIDCKGHPGWASYPTKLGNAMPEFATDTLALWRKVTKEEDIALYMHYSGVFDERYGKEHPADTVVDAKGNRVLDTTRTMGDYVDKLLIPQMTELIEAYDVDGFWVDGECWHTKPDYHPDTVAAFERETGIDLGGNPPVTPSDPYYHEWMAYNRELFLRYVRHYVDAIHEKFPHVQITSNWLFSDYMPEPVSADVDFLSGDFNPHDSVNSARYAGRALAQQEHPWDLMSWNFRIAFGSYEANVAKHPRQLMQEAAAAISLGGAYQNYVKQYDDGSPNVTDVLALEELAEFVRAREPFCFRGKAVHQAALLLSAYDRYRESESLFLRTGNRKIMGATALLCDIGQSLEIVSEHTLEKYLDEYKMIVVPELYAGLAPETTDRLLDYAKRGGKLVLTGAKTCEFFAASGAPFAAERCEAFLDEAKRKAKPYYFTTDEKAFGVAFSPCKIIADGECVAYLSEELTGTRDCVASTIRYGAGSITAIGFDIGQQYFTASQYTQRDLMKRVADSLYTPTVQIESAYGLLEIVVLEKDGKRMIQLLSGGGTHPYSPCATNDYVPPVLDIRLSIALPEAPKKLILQPEGKELSVEYRDGRAYVAIDRVDIHSVIEVRQ